jgi:hypothetical protein
MNSSFIKEFLQCIRPRLRAIASQTKGEASVDDLQNEAYLLLLEFIDENLREPTLDDRGWVISRIYNKYIKWTDYKFRNAVRLEGLENEEGNSFVLDLPAPSISNPLVEILYKEDQLEHEVLLNNSYSEAKAYMVTFTNFNQDKVLLSSYFLITTRTLNKRFDRAIVILVNQPSLFDAIEFIDESFTPKPGTEKFKTKGALLKAQLALALECVMQ